MQKVKLLLEDLHVESFALEAHSQGAGTVRGLEIEGSGVYSECITHCLSDCEACLSIKPTHCDVDCPSWDGNCRTDGDWTCDWDCGTTIDT